MGREGRNHKDSLEYTADGIRDTASELGRNADEQAVTASMVEEQAKATHRLAAAVEELTETIRQQE